MELALWQQQQEQQQLQLQQQQDGQERQVAEQVGGGGHARVRRFGIAAAREQMIWVLSNESV